MLAVRTRAGAPVRAPTRQAARRPPAAAKATPPRKGVAASGNGRPRLAASSGRRVAASASAAAAAQPGGAGDSRVVSTDFLVRFIARGAAQLASGMEGWQVVASLRAHAPRARRCWAAASLA